METIEGNKIIAAFDGWKFNEDGSVQHDRFNDHGQKTDMVENILNNYHTSFDWLMPVVEKIEAIEEEYGAVFHISGKLVSVLSRDGKTYEWNGGITSETKMMCVWWGAVQYIKWLNSNKNKNMRKFRKKPVVIQAVQFTGENFDEIIDFTKGNAVLTKAVGGDEQGSGTPQLYQKLTITTTHQGQTVDLVSGDWVIPEPDSINFYPCKQDIFRNTYEEVID